MFTTFSTGTALVYDGQELSLSHLFMHVIPYNIIWMIIKVDQMSIACITHGRDEKSIQNVGRKT